MLTKRRTRKRTQAQVQAGNVLLHHSATCSSNPTTYSTPDKGTVDCSDGHVIPAPPDGPRPVRASHEVYRPAAGRRCRARSRTPARASCSARRRAPPESRRKSGRLRGASPLVPPGRKPPHEDRCTQTGAAPGQSSKVGERGEGTEDGDRERGERRIMFSTRKLKVVVGREWRRSRARVGYYLGACSSVDHVWAVVPTPSRYRMRCYPRRRRRRRASDSRQIDTFKNFATSGSRPPWAAAAETVLALWPLPRQSFRADVLPITKRLHVICSARDTKGYLGWRWKIAHTMQHQVRIDSGLASGHAT